VKVWFEWLWAAIKTGFDTLYVVLWDIIDWAWDAAVVAVMWLKVHGYFMVGWYLDWLEDLTPKLLDKMVALAQSAGLEWDKETFFGYMNTVYAVVEGLDWFIPVTFCLTLFVVTLQVVMVIRLVRFIIGWIPTIEG